jgi:hypothetical protein
MTQTHKYEASVQEQLEQRFQACIFRRTRLGTSVSAKAPTRLGLWQAYAKTLCACAG